MSAPSASKVPALEPQASLRSSRSPHVGRRGFFSFTALAGFGASSAAVAAPKDLAFGEMKKEADTACIYHCDFGDPARFGQMLNNINNHLSVYEFDPFKVKIVIVAHGAGVKFFLKDVAGTPWEKDSIDPDLIKRLNALAQYGVDVHLCRITFTRLKLDLGKVRDDPQIRMVASGVATVAELQGRGFAYLKVA